MLRNDSSYKVTVSSKLAFFMSALGFSTLVLIPYTGVLPGLFLVGYSGHLCKRIGAVGHSNDLIKASVFLNFSAIAFLFAITSMFVSILYF